jgi:GWxTD domain-containing protein
LYSRALLSLEEFRNEPFALAATDGDLRGRIERLLGLEKSQPRWSGSASLLLLLIVTATVAALAQQAPTPPKPRSIEEMWIHSVEISPEEKDAFALLQTEAERKRFIEQFWERRDPTPGTPRNEAKEERDRRIRYSNQRFGSESREGWNTARGRIYIVHGPPDEIESHPAEKREVWFYHTGLQFEFQGEDYELASQKREVEAKPFFVASFDVSAVPEPARGQLSSELNAFKGQPISNALMDRIRAVVRRIQPDLVTTWALKRDTRTASVAVSPPWMK